MLTPSAKHFAPGDHNTDISFETTNPNTKSCFEASRILGETRIESVTQAPNNRFQ
jgi:hypothetical protein